MAHVIPVILEKNEGGVMAYNDELQVVATGASETEAMDQFRACIEAHVHKFGSAVLEPFARRQYRLVEVP